MKLVVNIDRPAREMRLVRVVKDEDVVCEDMRREILTRLPVKTLIRFKQVSKTWMHIITCPKFIRAHYYRYNSILHGSGKPFFVMRNPFSLWYAPDSRITEISTTSFSIVDHPCQCIIHEEDIRMPLAWRTDLFRNLLYSIGGEILSAGLGLYCLFNFLPLQVALWNPATREIQQLPPSPFTDGIVMGINNDVIGFGHTEFNGKLSYKVGILCSQPHKHNFSYLHLYSSATSAWKLFKCDIGYWRPSRNHAVKFNGMIHFLSASMYHLSPPCIITFDYANECFGKVIQVLPDAPSWQRYCMIRSRLTLYADKYLCLIMFCNTDKFFDVWVMREYGVRESWSKLGSTVSFNNGCPWCCTMGGVFFWEYDKGAALHSLWLYNCTSASPQVTRLPITTPNGRPFMCALERTESLVSICEPPLTSLHLWITHGITTLNLHHSLPSNIQSLPHNFGDLHLLRELDLSSNSLVVLPESLGRLYCLTKLNVDNNSLESIPLRICQCKTLLELHASHNLLTHLPDTIGQLYHLKLLSVAHNNIDRLTFTAQMMIGLKHLYASNNLLQHISNEVCWAPSLEIIDVSFNRRLRALPDRIGDIGTLRDLNICHTVIAELPETFRSLTLLQSFRANRTLLPESLTHSEDAQDVVRGVEQLVAKRERKKSKIE